MEKMEALEEELSKINVSDRELRAMNELIYTASETGILPFKFHSNEDLKVMIKLCILAKQFKDGVPDNFKM